MTNDKVEATMHGAWREKVLTAGALCDILDALHRAMAEQNNMLLSMVASGTNEKEVLKVALGTDEALVIALSKIIQAMAEQ